MRKGGRHTADNNLLMALACGATIENAARSAGVSTTTVHRRMREPEFQQELQKVRADMVQRVAGMLTGAAGEAVKTLVALLNPSVPPVVRLGAARAILELGVKLRESAELEQRITVLEEQLRDTVAA
jgi:hypothetical protein